MIAVVVPSNRPTSLSTWRVAWAREFDRPDVKVYEVLDEPATWATIEKEWGSDSWIIPTQTDAIRSWGFWQAWRDGAEYIITLDDDCYPSTPHFIDTHLRALTTPLAPLGWFSTASGLLPRGIPYTDRRAVALNMGGWRGNPDVDGQTQLAMSPDTLWAPVNRYVPDHLVAPICSMNLAFHRRWVPAMYQLLMGPGWGVDRFGDIWSGLIAQNIARTMGEVIHVGIPYIEHVRASDPHLNRAKEAPGLAMHEEVWEDLAHTPLHGHDIPSCYSDIAWHLATLPDLYWQTLSEAMLLWLERCDK